MRVHESRIYLNFSLFFWAFLKYTALPNASLSPKGGVDKIGWKWMGRGERNVHNKEKKYH